ncbi:hypothetical protein GGF32_006126 [Allomyces javanicus]|nr:hypothetical protein GGF32_006126 [Allomyces javanicus]
MMPFYAHLVGGSARDLLRLRAWYDRFGQVFVRWSCSPQHIEMDEDNNRVRFWMPRAPGMVHDMMRESGMTIAGVRLEFAPADPRDAIPAHAQPLPRAVFVLFHLPTPFRDVLLALANMHVRRDLLDFIQLPAIPQYPYFSYGFLTVPSKHAERTKQLDRMMRARGHQLRAFWLEDAKTLFADRDRLMDTLSALAKTVMEEELGHESRS